MRYATTLILALLILAAGCPGSDTETSSCQADEVRACTCPGGDQSVQICRQDGGGFEDCPCGDSDVSYDLGRDLASDAAEDPAEDPTEEPAQDPVEDATEDPISDREDEPPPADVEADTRDAPPEEPCQPMGAPCGAGLICDPDGACGPGCIIDEGFVADGEVSPLNACEVCAPSQSTTSWSPAVEGTDCAPERTCDGSGTCRTVCESACGTHCGPGGEPERAGVQIFYYPWYSNPSVDGDWWHWDGGKPGGGSYDPDEDDITAAFYPALGLYSSADPAVLEQHMQWLERAGVGVLILSWWGPTSRENQRANLVLDAADEHDFKVAFYIEPHSGGYLDTIRPVGGGGNPTGTRTPSTAANDVRYLIDRYGCHEALYRVEGRPVFYFFAAREYQAGNQDDWNTVWDELHADPDYNPIVIAHDTNLAARILPGGWDGGHEYGCSWGQEAGWAELVKAYVEADRLLVLNVCPGYDDSRVNLVGGPETDREDGAYYDSVWSYAVSTGPLRPHAVAVGTFNEWHEGTQIEPAQPMEIPGFIYLDYDNAYGLTDPDTQTAYLDRTRRWGDRFLLAEPGSCGTYTISDGGGDGCVAPECCQNSEWKGVGGGLRQCSAEINGEATVLRAVYEVDTTDPADVYLDQEHDLSGAYCGGYNTLEIRLFISSLDHYADGWVEIGNCMDCPQELQWRITPSMLAPGDWATVRFELRSDPNFANVDWSAVDHFRYYVFSDGTGTGDSEPFHIDIDDVAITW